MRQRVVLLSAAFVTMSVMCSVPARGATSCPWGDVVDFIDPVVMVLDGPGDVAQEQERWSSLGGQMMGMQKLYFSGQSFDLERVE